MFVFSDRQNTIIDCILTLFSQCILQLLIKYVRKRA